MFYYVMYEHDSTASHPDCTCLIFFQEKYQHGGRASATSPTCCRCVYHLWRSAGTDTEYAVPYTLCYTFIQAKTHISAKEAILYTSTAV